jgi:hypothetical protein
MSVIRLPNDVSPGDGGGGLRRGVISAFMKLPPSARKSVLHTFGKYAPWEEGFDPTPPSLHPGEITAAPDFVGIGTQKAGTTWWYEAVSSHPQVYSRADVHKERHFFDRYAMQPFGPDDSARYRGWFPRPPGQSTGEWTPDYLGMPWVPPLVSLAAPQTKLLVLLRDPVDRVSSGLAHVQRDTGRVTLADRKDAIARGFYHEPLSWWLRYFPLEQILVLQFERCLLDPVGQISRTYEFLGLDPFVPQTLDEKVNSSSHVPKMEEETRKSLAQLYLPDVRALCTSFPEIDLRLWPNFR